MVSAFQKGGVLDYLEKCQYHPNKKVYEASSLLLTTYFDTGMDQGEDEMGLDVFGNSRQEFRI